MIPITLRDKNKYQVSIDLKYEHVHDYEGSYEFTPTEESQTIFIDGTKAVGNIIINPIPNNYGKVTRVGALLTIE